MSAVIYLEGGGDSKELRVRCREGFRKLLESCGLHQRRPKLVACGSREATFDCFKTRLANDSGSTFVAMLIDSEDPIGNIEATWDHLSRRDAWGKPRDASDEQVLLMVTCMETWIVVDRSALEAHYGSNLQESALPSLHDMEIRSRDQVQQSLSHATRNCSNSYTKGHRSFEILAKLSPVTLGKILPSFARIVRILCARC